MQWQKAGEVQSLLGVNELYAVIKQVHEEANTLPVVVVHEGYRGKVTTLLPLASFVKLLTCQSSATMHASAMLVMKLLQCMHEHASPRPQ